MTTASETISRWARRFLGASACWLVLWQAAALAGASRRVGVTLGLYGFVLHALFGKAYSLVPSYFDRELAAPRVPAVHLPLAAGGTACLAVAALGRGPERLEPLGATLWTAGVALFLGALGWTVRDNLAGRETGTADHEADRRPVDRAGNAVVPIALLYLALGAYELLAGAFSLPALGHAPRRSHLLAAGTAALALFGVGFRLLPRFLVAAPPRALVAAVLPAGAVGPLALALGLPAGPLLWVGAALEGIAVVGFAAAYLWLFLASDRDRVGFYGVLGGVLAGTLAVAIAAHLVVAGPTEPLVHAHYRLMLSGFLGLSIVGVVLQFYPPTVARVPGAGDRLAGIALAALAAGVLLEAVGLVLAGEAAALAGRALALAGAVGYAYLLFGAFRA